MPRKPARPVPLIKGLFVNSHVTRLREEKGEDAVRELEQRHGGRVFFKNLEDVPVREEVRIIELCLEVLEGITATSPDYHLQAGRLHYRNFSATALGRALLSSLPHTPASLRTLLINSGSIARSVFKHTNFSCTDNRKSLAVVMENTDYPLGHFEGFLNEWADTYGMARGSVRAHAEGHTHHYTISGF